MGSAASFSSHVDKVLTTIPSINVDQININQPTVMNIHGRISNLSSNDLLIAPVSGKKCVYYKVIVQKRWFDENMIFRWETKIIEENYTKFEIIGINQFNNVVVTNLNHPNQIKQSIYNSSTYETGKNGISIFQREPMPEGIKNLLKRNKFEVERNILGFIKKRYVRYTETILEVNDEINIMGIVTPVVYNNFVSYFKIEPIPYKKNIDRSVNIDLIQNIPNQSSLNQLTVNPSVIISKRLSASDDNSNSNYVYPSRIFVPVNDVSALVDSDDISLYEGNRNIAIVTATVPVSEALAVVYV